MEKLNNKQRINNIRNNRRKNLLYVCKVVGIAVIALILIGFICR